MNAGKVVVYFVMSRHLRKSSFFKINFNYWTKRDFVRKYIFIKYD